MSLKEIIVRFTLVSGLEMKEVSRFLPIIEDCRLFFESRVGELCEADMRRLEVKSLEGVEFSAVTGLRLEAVEKLNKVRPANVGQASRISGVSPADISVLLIYLAKKEREKKG